MAQIDLRHDIDCDEDTFWEKCFLDQAFQNRMYLDELKFPAYEVLEQKEEGDKVFRRVRVDPPVGNLPGPVKKVIGDKLTYTEEGTFDRKAKRYTFKVMPSAMPDKTKVSGELWVEKAGDKKVVRRCKMSVEVKVFMVGGMVEDKLCEDLRSSYDKGAAFTNVYIKEKGL
jgi:hypothetical protein